MEIEKAISRLFYETGIHQFELDTAREIIKELLDQSFNEGQKSIYDGTTFLGKPVSYWIELEEHTAHLVEKEREAIRTKIENLTMIDEKYAHWAKKEILGWCFPPKNQALDQAIDIVKGINSKNI